MLSSKVYSYLKRNPRRFKMTKEDVLGVFTKCEIPPLPQFVDFQLKFGGYCPDEEMTFGIVTPFGLDDRTCGAEKFNDVVLVEFVVDCLVQISYSLDENGQIYYDGWPVAESFESYLSHRCYVDSQLYVDGQLVDNWTRIIHDRRDTKRFQKLFELQKTSRVAEASDKFLRVTRNDGLFLVERGEHYSELFVKPEIFYKKK